MVARILFAIFVAVSAVGYATAQSVTTLSFPEATDVHLESTYLFNVLGTAKDGSHTTYMAMPTLTAISGSPIPTDPITLVLGPTDSVMSATSPGIGKVTARCKWPMGTNPTATCTVEQENHSPLANKVLVSTVKVTLAPRANSAAGSLRATGAGGTLSSILAVVGVASALAVCVI